MSVLPAAAAVLARLGARQRKLVQSAANRLGFEIRRLPVDAGEGVGLRTLPKYEALTPNSTYSPWNLDQAFQHAYGIVRTHTLVDSYRCFELWKLVEQSAKLPTGNLIEVGVWRGGTGALIAQQAKNCGIPDRVFLCDTFTGVVKTGREDSSYTGGEHGDTNRALVEELIFGRMSLDNTSILEGIFPEQTARDLQNLKFRFCHIDVDAYSSAKDIMDWIWGRMIPGGIVVYDDYGFQTCDGITRYVEELMLERDRLVIYNLNGHAIVVKHASYNPLESRKLETED